MDTLSEQWLTRIEAEAMLDLWLPREVSLARATRYGPIKGAKMEGRTLLFPLSGLWEWADNQTSRSYTDLRGTTLGDWMHGNGWSVPKFARHLCMGYGTLHRLLGIIYPSIQNRPLPRWEILHLVSLETGIAIETLMKDAMREKADVVDNSRTALG